MTVTTDVSGYGWNIQELDHSSMSTRHIGCVLSGKRKSRMRKMSQYENQNGNGNNNNNNDNSFRFEKWNVWKSSRDLVNRVFELTQEFPKEERIGLTMNMRNTAMEVSSHIASASVSFRQEDKVEQLEKAYLTSNIFASQSFIARDQSWINEKDADDLLEMVSKINAQLSGLKKSILNRDSEGSGSSSGGGNSGYRRSR